MNQFIKCLVFIGLHVWLSSAANAASPAESTDPELLQSTEIIRATALIKLNISEQLLQGHKASVTEKPGEIHARVDFLRVTPGGTIVLHAGQPDFFLVLSPTLEGNVVLWNCTAYPPRLTPKYCR